MILPPLLPALLLADVSVVIGPPTLKSIFPPVTFPPLTVNIDVVSLFADPGPEEAKLAPAIIVTLPPFPTAELVLIDPAPAAVSMLVFATMARSCPEKFKFPAIVTAPAVLK